jgi:hypothetical protein
LNFWTLVVISFGRPISRFPRSTLLSKYSSMVTWSGLQPSYIRLEEINITINSSFKKKWIIFTGKGVVDSSKCCPTAKSELSKKPEPATLDLSSGLRCSVLVFVTNSTLLALKTLQSRPLTTSVLSDRQPQRPLLFLYIICNFYISFPFHAGE